MLSKYTVRIAHVLCICSLLLFGVHEDCIAASHVDTFLDGLKAINDGQERHIKKAYKKLAKSADKRLVQILFIHQQISAGREKKALEKVERNFLTVSDRIDVPARALIVLGHAALQLEVYTLSQSCFDDVTKNGTDYEKVLTALGLTELHLTQSHVKEASRYMDIAREYARAYDKYKEDKELDARIRHLSDMLNSVKDILLHGYGFSVYQDAQHARLRSRKYEEALRLYDSVIALGEQQRLDEKVVTQKMSTLRIYKNGRIDVSAAEKTPVYPVYVEASRFYRLLCLMKLGQVKKVRIEGAAFVESNPTGLYRGEASLMLGDSALFTDSDADRAAAYFTRAIEWVHQTEKHAVAKEMKVPQQSQVATAPPVAMKTVDAWGNRTWARIEPADVFNRTTVSWYLPYVAWTAHVNRALCLFSLGENIEALADLQATLTYDESEARLAAQGYYCNFLRLRDGFQRGRMYVTAEELGAFSGVYRVALLAAELAFETEQWALAEERYATLYQRMHKRGKKAQLSYLLYAQASAQLMMRKPKSCKELLAQILGKKGYARVGSITWARAQMLSASLHTEKSIRIRMLTPVLKKLTHVPTRKDVLVQLIGYHHALKEKKRAAQLAKKLEALLADTGDAYLRTFLRTYHTR